MSFRTCSIVLVILCVVSSGCYGAVFRGLGNNTDNDGCVVGSAKYAVGEVWFVPGRCVRYTCSSLRGDYSGATCGVILVSKECTISEVDNSKTYPDCCPRPLCPA